MPTRKLDDPGTKWHLEFEVDPSGRPPPGGLALKSLRHDGHNFAKDIRLIGFWVATQKLDAGGQPQGDPTNTFYQLDDKSFVISPALIYNPTTIGSNTPGGSVREFLAYSDAALGFSVYFDPGTNGHAGLSLRAMYDNPDLFKSLDNCRYTGINIEQIFLFSRYGDNPKHEPTGGLSAARCHPMTRYKFKDNPAFDNDKPETSIASIRFDSRLHLFIDRHYNQATNATLPQIGNQAGFFADVESGFKLKAGVAFGFIGTGAAAQQGHPYPRGSELTGALFSAIEKPLIYEAFTAGLTSGVSAFDLTTPGGTKSFRCWDNVHWWGARGQGQPIISAPGGFHAAHMHWRWGAAAESLVGGDPAFNPTVYPAGAAEVNDGAWGPLVDPKIWTQTIGIAVTKNTKRFDPTQTPLTELSKAKWSDLFDSSGQTPVADISAGAEIVLWYTSLIQKEVILPVNGQNRRYTSDFSGGTVFLHGIFFPHDAEKTGLKIGTTVPEYKPVRENEIRKHPKWFRAIPG